MTLPPHSFSEAHRQGLYKAIELRRDVRQFRPDPIPDEILARILNAAHRAGSVGYMQPWNFILVQDHERRKEIRRHVEQQRLRAAEAFEGKRREDYLSFKLEGILDSPLNICVTCDRQRGGSVLGRFTMRETDLYSTCCAIQNLWLAARAEGIGVGWVSIMEPEEIGRLLGIPENAEVVAYLCIGQPVKFHDRPELESAGWRRRLPLEELVFSESWGQSADAALVSSIRGLTTKEESKPSPANLNKSAHLL